MECFSIISNALMASVSADIHLGSSDWPSDSAVLLNRSMSFSKAGEYEICYSSKKDISVPRTCLQVDVLQAKLI